MLANRKTAGPAMSRRWGFMVLGIILSVLFGSKAEADIRKGIAAYQRGDYRAGNELGILHVEGKGVRADKIEGFAWMYTGTHMDIMDDKALANAMRLARTMSKEELHQAQERGKSYYQRCIKPHMNVVRTLLNQPS